MNFFNIRIEIYSVIRDLIKNIWVIFLAMLMAIMGLYIATKTFHTPEYTAKALIVVNAKSSTAGSGSLFTRSVEMTKVISKVIVDKSIKDKAMDKLGVDEFDGVLFADIEKGTNFLTLAVKSDTPQNAYNLLVAVLEAYPEVSDTVFNNAVITVMQMPQMPSKPSNSISNTKRLLAVAAVTVFAAGCVVILSVLRDTVKDEEDFNNKLDAKLLGTIPHERMKFKIRGGFDFNKKPLIIHNNAFITLGFVENFHKIAAKIEHFNRRNGSKVFAVTSVVENEGKSTVAANIAISLADRGHKVILIDMDCKSPALYNLFEKKYSEKAEFSNLMNGSLKTNEFRLRRYKQSSLYLALNTQPYEEYGDWVKTGNLDKVIEVFKNQVDFIIMDVAPVTVDSVVTDIVKIADETILNIRTDIAYAPDINDTLTTIKEVGGACAGCILNDVYPEFSFLALAGLDESGFQYGFKYGKYRRNANKYSKYGKYGKYGRYGRYGAYSEYDKEFEEDK